ncbi:hypothetical protein YC2023_081226 [Brassica napus]
MSDTNREGSKDLHKISQATLPMMNQRPFTGSRMIARTKSDTATTKTKTETFSCRLRKPKKQRPVNGPLSTPTCVGAGSGAISACTPNTCYSSPGKTPEQPLTSTWGRGAPTTPLKLATPTIEATHLHQTRAALRVTRERSKGGNATLSLSHEKPTSPAITPTPYRVATPDLVVPPPQSRPRERKLNGKDAPNQSQQQDRRGGETTGKQIPIEAHNIEFS